MINGFRRAAIAAGLIVALVGVDLHSATEHKSAFASASSGCTGTAAITPTHSTLSDATARNVSIVASGLDPNSQVNIAIYDAANRSAQIIPLTSATTDGSGNYSGSGTLPGGGWGGGGRDTIVVADAGARCAAGSFFVDPSVHLSGATGFQFTFGGSGFPNGATVTITYLDANGATSTVATVSANGYGQISGYNQPIPAGAASGRGTLTFTSGASSASVPFTFTQAPATATLGPSDTPGPNQPTGTATATNIPGVPTATSTVGFGNATATTTSTNIPGVPTATSTVGFSAPTNTRVPSPSPSRTPIGPIATNTATVPPATATSTRQPGFPTSTPRPTATVTRCRLRCRGPVPTPAGQGSGFPTPTPIGGRGGAGGFPTPTPIGGGTGGAAGFPSPTPIAGGQTNPPPPAQCGLGMGIANGGFEQHLRCWSVNAQKAVIYEVSRRHAGSYAVRLTASRAPALLGQSFLFDGKTAAIGFYYWMSGASATAQLADNGLTVAGRRLTATGGRSFTHVLIALPPGLHRGDTLTITFAVTRGALFVDDVSTLARAGSASAGKGHR